MIDTSKYVLEVLSGFVLIVYVYIIETQTKKRRK